MCIAIFKPENVILPESTLRNCWRNNPDGAGFMYVKNKKLVVEKGLMTYSAFRKAYKSHEDKRVVLHFRATSHGKTNETNTHPHRVNDRLAFVHNGIIRNITVSHTQEESDTYLFNEEILQKLPENFIKSAGLRLLIEDYIGFSKLIFMTNTGYVYIFNAQSGEADRQGVWYSNDSYRDSIKKERNGGTWEYDEETGEMVFKKRAEVVVHRTTAPISQYANNQVTIFNDNKNSTPPSSTTVSTRSLVYDKEEDMWVVPTNPKPKKVESCLECSSPMFREMEQKLGYCSICLTGIVCPHCGKRLSLEALGCMLCDDCSTAIPERKLAEILEKKFTHKGSEDLSEKIEAIILEEQKEVANKIVHAHGLEIIDQHELVERAKKLGQIIIEKYEGI